MKRVVTTLTLDQLEKLIELPKGVHLKGVRDNWHMLGIDLLLEGDRLDVEEYIPATEPLRLDSTDILGGVQ